MAKRKAKLLQLLVSQLPQDREINVVLREPLRVLGEPELFKKLGDVVHAALLRSRRSLPQTDERHANSFWRRTARARRALVNSGSQADARAPFDLGQLN